LISGSRRTDAEIVEDLLGAGLDSTDAAAVPIDGRPPRRTRRSCSTSPPRSASSAIVSTISSLIGAPSAFRPCIVDIIAPQETVRSSVLTAGSSHELVELLAVVRSTNEKVSRTQDESEPAVDVAHQ